MALFSVAKLGSLYLLCSLIMVACIPTAVKLQNDALFLEEDDVHGRRPNPGYDPRHTRSLTKRPTPRPTNQPTSPTNQPTNSPTNQPTNSPTERPTQSPSSPSSILDIKLVGGTESEGNVFMKKDGQWRPVCDDDWDIDDATVACRALGFSGGAHITRSKFGSVPTNFVLDDVKCNGTETSLWQCPHVKHHNCASSEGAGVVCRDIDIKLVGGTKSQGNVFMKKDGQWRPVCDDAWSADGATVACRSLGFIGRGAHTSQSKFGRVPSNFVLDDVQCKGTETSLWQCPRWKGTHDCWHNEGAGVVCNDIDIKLVGGTESQGNVYMRKWGEWMPICDDHWDAHDATVACRALGFSGGAHKRGSKFGSVATNFLMDVVNCNGTETSLWQCPHRRYNHHYCGIHQGAGVVCGAPSRRYQKSPGHNCNGSGEDILRDYVGTAAQCEAKCNELNCIGFIRVNSGDGGYAGKCYFRGGVLQQPTASPLSAHRDCYAPIGSVAAVSLQELDPLPAKKGSGETPSPKQKENNNNNNNNNNNKSKNQK